MSAAGLERWRRLWRALDAEGPADAAWERLAQAYSEPHRAYHTLAHIQDCLAQLDEAETCQVSENLTGLEVEAALWFHDVVYDPHAADNEARSADLAEAAWRAGRVAAERIERIRALILATRHQAPPANAAEAFITDIDLSILGRAPAEFDRYERAIRFEYAWVAEADYRRGRAAVLESFLQRTPLFHTPAFQQAYEARAKDNLARLIRDLRGQKI